MIETLIKMRKRVIRGFVASLLLSFVPVINQTYSLDFLNDFALPLLDGGDIGQESAFDLGVKDDVGLLENLRKIFYPATDQGTGGVIWRAIRIIGVGVFIALLIWIGSLFIRDAADKDKIRRAQLSLIYLILGAAVFFLASWILGSALDFGAIDGLTDGDNSALEQVENNIVVLVVSFLKAVAFFVAIVFLVYYGYRMMNSFDNVERLKTARTGMLNVIMALVFIKVIDYLYYIAQKEDFKSRAIEFIVEASKLMGWIFGLMMVLIIIYAGYVYVTSTGNESRIKQATNILRTAGIVVLMVLLFMVIVYQVFQDLLG